MQVRPLSLMARLHNLEVNNAINCNHSGSTGWDSSLFELVEVSDHGLTLYTERTDGTGGFPGNFKIWISYYLEETGAYEISYKVTTSIKMRWSIQPTTAISTYSVISRRQLTAMSSTKYRGNLSNRSDGVPAKNSRCCS